VSDAWDDPSNWPEMSARDRLAQLRTEHHDFVGAAGSKLGGLAVELHAAHDALREVLGLVDGVVQRRAVPATVDVTALDRAVEVARAALAPLPAQPAFGLPADERRRLAELIGGHLIDPAGEQLDVSAGEAAVMFVCGHYLGHLLGQGLLASPRERTADEVLGQVVDDFVARPAVVEHSLALAAHYFSTYCVHGDHGHCRVTCKTCLEPCRCSCHRSSEAGPG
jgi:hypothetical protein